MHGLSTPECVTASWGAQITLMLVAALSGVAGGIGPALWHEEADPGGSRAYHSAGVPHHQGGLSPAAAILPAPCAAAGPC